MQCNWATKEDMLHMAAFLSMRGREKEEEGEEVENLEISSLDPSPAGDFSPHREKKRLPADMPYAYRSVPGTIPYRAELGTPV
ncbi:hypothetical protein BHM03_00014672 [Ensete ventricosum]|nr:hypothetical protein BHM03_00014672 [Ensete ventricosum]